MGALGRLFLHTCAHGRMGLHSHRHGQFLSELQRYTYMARRVVACVAIHILTHTRLMGTSDNKVDRLLRSNSFNRFPSKQWYSGRQVVA